MSSLPRARLSLHLRAWAGVLLLAFVVFMCFTHPVDVVGWVRHPDRDAIIAAILAVFHVWNTYSKKIVVP
jgi:hypothetical protein